jgi:hypothetical protein
MSFFPPDPEMPEPEEGDWTPPPWAGPPEDELPAVVPVSEILATTEHVAIALIGVHVHREGIELRLERRLRRNGLSTREWHELCAVFMEHWPTAGMQDPQDRLRFGVVLGDGERVLADEWPHPGMGDPSEDPSRHRLTRRGGGGGGSGSTYSSTDGLWLWPAPPAGAIELVMQWPALGIDERRTILDANAMLELVPSAKPFWPAGSDD